MPTIPIGPLADIFHQGREGESATSSALPLLQADYAAMAADEAREHDAEAWVESLIGDVAADPDPPN